MPQTITEDVFVVYAKNEHGRTIEYAFASAESAETFLTKELNNKGVQLVTDFHFWRQDLICRGYPEMLIPDNFKAFAATSRVLGERPLHIK